MAIDLEWAWNTATVTCDECGHEETFETDEISFDWVLQEMRENGWRNIPSEGGGWLNICNDNDAH